MFGGALQRCSGKTSEVPPKQKWQAVNSSDWLAPRIVQESTGWRFKTPTSWAVDTKQTPRTWHFMRHPGWFHRDHPYYAWLLIKKSQEKLVVEIFIPNQSPTNNPWGVFQLRSFHDPKKSALGGQVTRGASPEMAPMTKNWKLGSWELKVVVMMMVVIVMIPYHYPFFVTIIICVIIITTKPCLTSCLFGELVEWLLCMSLSLWQNLTSLLCFSNDVSTILARQSWGDVMSR